MPRLIVPGVRLATIVANSRKTRPDQREAFYNRDLGEAYAASEGRLSLDQVEACVREDLRPLESLSSPRFVTMGVDVASARALNVTIEEMLDERSGRRVFVGEVEDRPGESAFDQLCSLMDRFRVAMACIDHAPDGRFSQAFAAKFPGRVYRVGYYSPQPGHRMEPQPYTVDDAEHYMGLWRTVAIDACLSRFRDGHVHLPPLDLLPADYPAHLGALVRRHTELPNGSVRVEYVKTGADDYAHAEVYNLAAVELQWRRVGLRAVQDMTASPFPMLESGQGSSLADWDSEPEYRPGLEP